MRERRGLVLGRLGERAAIQLAVVVERQRLKVNERARYHEFGQLHPQRFAERLVARVLRTGHQVAHQPLLASGSPREDRRVAHARKLAGSRFDLAELDAVAADLDLLIVAADVEDRPVGGVADEVAAPVELRGNFRAEGVLDEAFGVELRGASGSRA